MGLLIFFLFTKVTPHLIHFSAAQSIMRSPHRQVALPSMRMAGPLVLPVQKHFWQHPHGVLQYVSNAHLVGCPAPLEYGLLATDQDPLMKYELIPHAASHVPHLQGSVSTKGPARMPLPRINPGAPGPLTPVTLAPNPPPPPPPPSFTCPSRPRCAAPASHAHQGRVVVPDGQARGEQAKDEEGLRARLVRHVVLDGVRDEELDLREHLRACTGSSLCK